MTNITQLNDGHWVSIMSKVCFKYQHIKINKTFSDLKELRFKRG